MLPHGWVCMQMVDLASHHRSNVCTAMKAGRRAPWYIYPEDYRVKVATHPSNPDHFKKKRDATARRNESVRSSHLGSGGWDSFYS